MTSTAEKPDPNDVWKGTYHEEGAMLYNEWDYTRQALFEARCEGIHSFRITIDDDAEDYLPHMYGAINYAVINDVKRLPLKVSDIYRQLTS